MNVTIEHSLKGHEIYRFEIIDSKFKFKYWTGEGKRKLFSYEPFYNIGEIELQYLVFEISEGYSAKESENVQSRSTGHYYINYFDDDTMESFTPDEMTIQSLNNEEYYQIRFWEITNENNKEKLFKIHHPIEIMIRGDKLNEILLPIGLNVLEKYKKEFRQEKENLELKKSIVLNELDVDGNGQVDSVESNDFNLLLRKHQNVIIDIDRDYVKKFTKISIYLKDKKNNIDLAYNAIKDESDEHKMDEYIGLLKNEINTYHSVLVNGISMLIALLNNDILTYEEIYDALDRVNIFDSQWEKDLSQKLSNIENGINDLLVEMQNHNENIIEELSKLTFATESGFNELSQSISTELKSIDSSIKFNNLLTGIQTYQLYKINKNTTGIHY